MDQSAIAERACTVHIYCGSGKKIQVVAVKDELHIHLSEEKRIMNRDKGTYIHRWLLEVTSEKSA